MNIEKLKIMLSMNPKEFQNIILQENQELFEYLSFFRKEDEIKNVISIIQDDEINEESEKNILINLLSIEPFSSPIVEKFIETKFLNEKDFIKKVDLVRLTTYHLVDSLEELKRKIRNDKTTHDKDETSKKLEAIIKEIKKHEKKLEESENLKNSNHQLKELKNKINKIEKELNTKSLQELEKKMNDYIKLKEEMQNIMQEIEMSKKIFTTLPKDEA